MTSTGLETTRRRTFAIISHPPHIEGWFVHAHRRAKFLDQAGDERVKAAISPVQTHDVQCYLSWTCRRHMRLHSFTA